LAKLVYFTRSPVPPESAPYLPVNGHSPPSTPPSDDSHHRSTTPPKTKHNGALTPLYLEHNGQAAGPNFGDNNFRGKLLRRASLQHFPGGSLNFERFETDNIHECVQYIQELIEQAAAVNRVSIAEMRKGVKVMATGGGAHKFYELFSQELHVEVLREDEMECLITGLNFITLIPNEVYSFSDELIYSVSHSGPGASQSLERPSPNPPQYSVTFETNPLPQLPCLLVNIGSGVSIIKVDEDGKFERISGTSLGGGTLWGLLSLLTPATSFDGVCRLRYTITTS
jgi:type II pantothenate kinase